MWESKKRDGRRNEYRSSEISTNSGGTLKECLRVFMVAKWRRSVRTVTGEIANSGHLQALNNRRMKFCIVWNVSIAWVPVCRSAANADHAFIVHRPVA
jgi:hypothetical protein